MNPTTTRRISRLRCVLLTAGLLAAGGALAACSGGSGSAPTTGAAATPTGGPVLPVTENPINNSSAVEALKITSVLVENNIDGSGNPVSDHLEVALANSGTTELAAFEVFYTYTDPTTNITESYYVKLPADFTIPAGGERIAHFDNTGAPDHFPVNEFSLYYTDANALDVSVTVSATDAVVQTATLHKDAGGPETAD